MSREQCTEECIELCVKHTEECVSTEECIDESESWPIEENIESV